MRDDKLLKILRIISIIKLKSNLLSGLARLRCGTRLTITAGLLKIYAPISIILGLILLFE